MKERFIVCQKCSMGKGCTAKIYSYQCVERILRAVQTITIERDVYKKALDDAAKTEEYQRNAGLSKYILVLVDQNDKLKEANAVLRGTLEKIKNGLNVTEACLQFKLMQTIEKMGYVRPVYCGECIHQGDRGDCGNRESATYCRPVMNSFSCAAGMRKEENKNASM